MKGTRVVIQMEVEMLYNPLESRESTTLPLPGQLVYVPDIGYGRVLERKIAERTCPAVLLTTQSPEEEE